MYYAAIAGIIGTLVTYKVMLLFVEITPFFSEMRRLSIYDLINIFLYTAWAPLFEETLFRGYFLEILKSWNNTGALLLSSLLFTLPHLFNTSLISSGAIFLLGTFILIDSIIFGMAYM